MIAYDSTLFQDLKGKADPAWLWDWARGRIVWANHPGITFWGEASLFDLLDHRFDPDSATVKKIRDISEKLESGEGSGDEVIFFPEAGQLVKCTCTITKLEDGRSGVLIAAKRTGGQKQRPGEGLMEQIVDHSPFALAVFDRAGRLIFTNPALQANLTPSDPDGEGGAGGKTFALAEWLGSEDMAHELVSRILLVGSHSEARSLKTKFGNRTHRMTARRLSTEEGETSILIVFQDIEDRRNYERELQTRLENLEAGREHDAPIAAQVAAGTPTPQRCETSETAKTSESSETSESTASSKAVSENRDDGDQSLINLLGKAAPALIAGAVVTGDAAASAADEDNESEAEAGENEAEAASETESISEADTDSAPEGEITAETGNQDEAASEAEQPVSKAMDATPDSTPEEPEETIEATQPEKTVEPEETEETKAEAEPEELEDAHHLRGRDKAAFSAIAEALRINNPVMAEQIRIDKSSETIALSDPAEPVEAAPGVTEDAPVETDEDLPEADGEVESQAEAKAESEAEAKTGSRKSAADKPDDAGDAATTDSGPSSVVTLVGGRAVQHSPLTDHNLTAGGTDSHQLKSILDSAVDGIFTLDGKGRVCGMNASAETILSITEKDIAGQPFTALLSEASARITQNYLDAVTETGVAGPFRDGREIEARLKDGGTLPLFLTIGPVTSDDQLEYCAVIRDISHWKNAEAELRKAKERAEQDNEKKSDFLARISHELRTPLNAIMGFSEVMSEEKFGPIANDRYKGYVSDIRNSSEHLLSLVNDLLDLTKIESGHLEMKFTSVNLGQIVGQCASLMQPQATRERIVMRTSMPDNLPPVVADHRSLRQIVLNLLSNAVKFTRTGGQVIVSALLGEDGEVRLQVRDTGIGMNSEELKKAMEPYRQIKAVNESGQPGTGLGLPLTKALAEANRAEFHISSEKDKGTLVQIVFPTTRVLAE